MNNVTKKGKVKYEFCWLSVLFKNYSVDDSSLCSAHAHG